MAVIVRKKSVGFISGTTTDNPLLIGATTINSAALAALPAVVSPDIAVMVLDADGSAGAPEIVYVTAHTAAATSATISRAQESTTARQHASGTDWFNGPTSKDFFPDNTTAGYVLTVQDANSGIPAWNIIPTKTFTIPHTWTISGSIAVPVSDTDYINPMFASLGPGAMTASLIGCRYIINSGTSVTFSININGSGATGFTSLSATTTATTTDPSDVVLATNDKIQPVVSAVSGTPKNFSVTIWISYTI